MKKDQVRITLVYPDAQDTRKLKKMKHIQLRPKRIHKDRKK